MVSEGREKMSSIIVSVGEQYARRKFYFQNYLMLPNWWIVEVFSSAYLKFSTILSPSALQGSDYVPSLDTLILARGAKICHFSVTLYIQVPFFYSLESRRLICSQWHLLLEKMERAEESNGEKNSRCSCSKFQIVLIHEKSASLIDPSFVTEDRPALLSLSRISSSWKWRNWK